MFRFLFHQAIQTFGSTNARAAKAPKSGVKGKGACLDVAGGAQSTDQDPLLRAPGFGEAEGTCQQLAAEALSTSSPWSDAGRCRHTKIWGARLI
jgi:hypothetical protein